MKKLDPNPILSDNYLELIHEIQNAGKIILEYLGKQIEPEEKSTNADYRTIVDEKVETYIRNAIERLFPDYNIYGEEHGEKITGSEYKFVIDPLDGTHNFILGIPAITTSVALLKNDEIVLGIINHPVTNMLYFALKGQGAYCNNSKLQLVNKTEFKNSIISYYCDYTASKERTVKFKNALLNLDIQRFLDIWSPAFCYCLLASGKINAIINDGIELYDYSAGKLIASEAGAVITDFKNNPDSDLNNTFLVATSKDIHHRIFKDVIKPIIAQ